MRTPLLTELKSQTSSKTLLFSIFSLLLLTCVYIQYYRGRFGDFTNSVQSNEENVGGVSHTSRITFQRSPQHAVVPRPNVVPIVLPDSTVNAPSEAETENPYVSSLRDRDNIATNIEERVIQTDTHPSSGAGVFETPPESSADSENAPVEKLPPLGKQKAVFKTEIEPYQPSTGAGSSYEHSLKPKPQPPSTPEIAQDLGQGSRSSEGAGSSREHSRLSSEIEIEPLTPPIIPISTLMEGESSKSVHFVQARCDSAVRGYEARVKPCSTYKKPENPHEIRLTMLHRISIPMVLNPRAFCSGTQCTAADFTKCCQPRRHCRNFPKDVPDVCPPQARANPYKYAFCRSIPCTMSDADLCCRPIEIKPRPMDPFAQMLGSARRQQYIFYVDLYERVAAWSKKSRILPNDKAEFTNPAISFSTSTVAWIDMSRSVIDPATGDEWAPLFDFMASWGPEYGWGESEAWIKIKQAKGILPGRPEDKYMQLHSSLDGTMHSWITIRQLQAYAGRPGFPKYMGA